MSGIPVHLCNIYQKPKVGNGFARQFPTYHYRHKISAMGGFDTASFSIKAKSTDDAQSILEDFIGNRVAIYVDNPVEPVWEGLINRLTFTAGAVQMTCSLDQMINRASVVYTGTEGSTTPSQTTLANNTASQAIYGIKQGQIDIGEHPLAAGKPNALRDTILSQRAWPQTSITAAGGGDLLIQVECIGFYWTLTWEKRFAVTGNVAFNTALTTYLGEIANAATFFNNADTTGITANATVQAGNTQRGATYWDLIRGIAECGDSTSYWVAGITPTSFTTGTRILYYRPAVTTIQYTAHMADGLIIRNTYGKVVPRWTVRPDCGILINDWLIAGAPVGDDPTQTYIYSIDYDADSQTVSYVGADNTQAEGYFQLKNVYRAFGMTPSVVNVAPVRTS